MNIKRLTKSKNKIFLSWLASYALILIIPIVIGSFAYIQSMETVRDEVNKAHNASLNQLKSVMDSKFEEINRLGGEVLLNQRIKNLMYFSRQLLPTDFSNINEIQKDLAKFKISNSFIDNIYIYINDSNFVFTDSSIYREDEFEYLSEKNFGISSVELMKIVHINQLRNYKIVTQDMGNGKFIKKVILFQSLYLTDLASPAGTLVIVIDEEKFIQLLKNLLWTPQGKVIVVNSRNEFITTGNISVLPQISLYENLKVKSKTFYEKNLGSQMAVTHIKSEVVDWEYVSLIPSEIFLRKVQYIKEMIFVYIGICLLLGSLTAYFFTKRNYSPVKRLTQMFINRIGKSEEEKGNEFSFLENSLKNLLEENECSTARLKQQNEAMRNNFLIRMMKGRIKSLEAIKDSLEAYGIQFKSDNYLVMIFSLEGLSSEIFEEDARDNEDTINLIYFVITNVVEEILGEKHIGYMTNIDGMIACLVNLKAWDKEDTGLEFIDEEMKLIAHKAIEFIQNKFGIHLSVAISGVHREISGVAKAYSEVLEIIEYKTLIEVPNKVIHYSSIQSTTRNNIDASCSLEKERQFINCIMAEDYKNAGCIFNDIINHFMKNIYSLQVVKCRMFGLVNSMLNALGEIKTERDIEFFDELDPANRLLNTKSVVELKKQADFIFERITEYYASKNKEQIPFWISEVEEFVENHYKEVDLSITWISEQLNINNCYLSRTYKKYKGFGLLDFIHKVRLEKVKELMKTELNMSDIAERVGYLESKAMIRAFKRYEGITPGRFRENE